ncbi:adaptin N terminal region-domain-containing protein [Dimargaris cristalligena]|uniref:AP-1 complex subunit gamma n=1 Tax=Dimargaris cristalligena TaxID=215637 RepID=A0A4Q0A0H4_9FUNG|nr:adaptin N terminal region-domain-containing protein [Dimargaris cristalligena]|eukprot:RKP39484.1 adaptin N terminal region-domain-containing protein [Dimargaris cristalligena]
MSFFRLRDLIRAVRCCKTAADERSVIQRESACIRTSFKEDNGMDSRYANVGKLLYIHLLGYPAHFGQIECLKLVASGRYSDKRLGYLGIMLLLDENQEILTLVTNSLKNDMNHSNMYIVSLALCTLGNIASVEVATDLVDEVERLMESSNTYVRKKAALCALRIVRKVPDLRDSFIEKTKHHLTDKNPGVVLSGLALANELCSTSERALLEYRALVPSLVRQLKSLLTAGFSPEYDVSGVSNPFVQVHILHLLRILGRGDAESSELMNDILTQVATNTDSTKNVGMSILYETAVTVLEIQSDTSLRVLAINILGKFLANRDNNIRYVALSTLTRAIATEGTAVQRHRNTILECLHDVDISIRRRALHLAFALIQPSNVRIMIRELLSFLEVADKEFKAGMTSNICAAAESFAPSRRWQVETVIRTFQLAGNYVKEENLYNFIALVSNQADLQPFVVHKLYKLLRQDLTQVALVQAAIWCIGEYGDHLWTMAPSTVLGSAEDSPTNIDASTTDSVSPSDVIQLLASILKVPYILAATRQMALTALVKLSDRLQGVPGSTAASGGGGSEMLDFGLLASDSPTKSPASSSSYTSQIRAILADQTSSVNVEIQQRAVEYQNLFRSDFESSRSAILERMPVPEYHPETTVAAGDLLLGGGVDGGRVGGIAVAGALPMGAKSPSATTRNDTDLLMDLMGDAPSAAPATSGSNGAPLAAPAASSVDLLADLFGDTSVSASANKSPAPAQNNLFDMLGGGGSGSSVASPYPQSPPTTEVGYDAYNQNGLRITLTPSKDASKPLDVPIRVLFSNQSTSDTFRDLLLQVAVPKSQQLHMQAPSSTSLSPNGGEATQQINIHNPNRSPIRLRLKLVYTKGNGSPVSEILEFSKFPSSVV